MQYHPILYYMMMMNTTDKYVSALNTFFRLKSEYENNKKKCPNCGAKATSADSFTLAKNVYKAKCANRENPCPLSIEIYNGKYESLQNTLITYREVFEEVKQHIIQLRMKYLFWYGTSIGRTVSSHPEENTVFLAEFKKLMERFTIAKQQYMDVVQQYQDSQFMYKEQAEEVNSLSNSISDIYNSLRESFPDLVLSWNQSDSERETLQDMIREQIRADDMKEKRSKLQYSIQGSIFYNDSGDGMSARIVQYVGGLDNLAFNTSGKPFTVREFVLDEPQAEDEVAVKKPQRKIVVMKTASIEEEEPKIVVNPELVEEEEEEAEEPKEAEEPEEAEEPKKKEEPKEAEPKEKQKRCPKGERRNKKTGKCEPKNK